MLVKFLKRSIIGGTIYEKDAEEDLNNDLADYLVENNFAKVIGFGTEADPSQGDTVTAQTNDDGSVSLVGPNGVIPTGRLRKTVAYIGDSITALAYRHGPTSIALATNGIGSFSLVYAENDCTTGTGLVNWDGTNLSWADDSVTFGAEVEATRNGIYFLPGATTNHGLFVGWYPEDRTYTVGTCQVTGLNSALAAIRNNADGFPNVAQARSGHVLDLVETTLLAGSGTTRPAIYGMGGVASYELVNAVWQFKQLPADVFVISVGTNDVNNVSSATQITTFKTSMTSMFTELLAAGKFLIVCSIPIRNANTTNQRKALHAMNRWLEDQCFASPSMYFADITTPITDTANGNWRSGYSSDNIHPINAGADAMGKAVADVIGLMPLTGPYMSGYDDVYDATYNPYGNILSTAGMAVMNGTSGTAGTGASGSFATGWTCNRFSGSAMTLTGSKVARTDGVPGDWQQIAFASAAANEFGQIYTSAAMAVTAGVAYEFYFEVQIPSAATGLLGVYANLDFNAGADSEVFGRNGNVAPSYAAGTKFTIGGTFIVPTGATTVQPALRIGSAAGGSGSVQFGRCVIRRKVGA